MIQALDNIVDNAIKYSTSRTVVNPASSVARAETTARMVRSSSGSFKT